MPHSLISQMFSWLRFRVRFSQLSKSGRKLCLEQLKVFYHLRNASTFGCLREISDTHVVLHFPHPIQRAFDCLPPPCSFYLYILSNANMGINVLYLPPHLFHSPSCDVLLSSCGDICSAGSRHLHSELRRPSQVPAGFTWWADQHLRGSARLLPLCLLYFLLHLQPTLGTFPSLLMALVSVSVSK